MIIKKHKVAIDRVTATWLVEVKLYGVIPRKLQVKIKVNKLKINGKNFCPSSPILPLIKSLMKLKRISAIVWILDGINDFLRVEKIINVIIRKVAITM